jgi:hypothetical protein
VPVFAAAFYFVAAIMRSDSDRGFGFQRMAGRLPWGETAASGFFSSPGQFAVLPVYRAGCRLSAIGRRDQIRGNLAANPTDNTLYRPDDDRDEAKDHAFG